MVASIRLTPDKAKQYDGSICITRTTGPPGEGGWPAWLVHRRFVPEGYVWDVLRGIAAIFPAGDERMSIEGDRRHVMCARLRDVGYRAVLGVGVLDRHRGYLLEVYSDGDHAELRDIAPIARVLAHYCVQAVTSRPKMSVSADALLYARG